MCEIVTREFGSEGRNCFSWGVELDNLRLICMLGQGNYARVYLVRNTCPQQETDQFFAMKML